MHVDTSDREAKDAISTNETARVGVYCHSPRWSQALGLASAFGTFELQPGQSSAKFLPAAEDPSTRAGMRNGMHEIRAGGVNLLMVLCDGRLRQPHGESLFIVEDHINLSGDNPLIGMTQSAGASRFIDMARAYKPAVQTLLQQAARHAGLEILRGIAVDGEPPTGSTASWPADAAVTKGLAEPVIAATHAGLTVGAVLWSDAADGTKPGGEGLEIKGISEFWNEFVSSLANRCRNV